jgi:hypothetical protein
MDWSKVLERLDPAAVTEFVRAGRLVVQAALYESERVRATHTPGAVDYNHGELSRSAPAGGWLSQDELRAEVTKLSEAIAAEKWTDGMLVMLRLLRGLGGV